MSKGTVIFVDDEEHLRIASRQTLDLAGYDVECFESAERALDLIGKDFEGVIVTDIRMPGMDGMELLQRVIEIDIELPVVLVTGHGDVQLAVEAMRNGAYDFIEKPFASNYLSDVVGRALDKRRLTLENRKLRSAVSGGDDIEAQLHGRSKVMVELRQQIRTIAQADADVLITGETGTGKEIVARALHGASARCDRPFIAINCGALPENFIESELFGHETNAFPGAMRPRIGKFEHARGGTVFLDEIETMPMALQIKLLRVVQERSITRLGSNDPVALDIRFIAASKENLETEVAAGRFRSDLLYRLNVITLRVSSLAERVEDIPRLFTQLVNEACIRYRRDIPEIPAVVLTILANREWPGNVRELRNAADRFVLGLGYQDGISPHDKSPETLAERVAEYERNAIVAELTANEGQLRQTYESLGLSRKTLYEKMQKYGLNRNEYSKE